MPIDFDANYPRYLERTTQLQVTSRLVRIVLKPLPLGLDPR